MYRCKENPYADCPESGYKEKKDILISSDYWKQKFRKNSDILIIL